MDYKKIYDALILSAQIDPKIDLYKEFHHIVPKCMGGTNEKSNLVKLTARQHFIAHWLLYKIYKTPELVHAWNCMRRIGVGQEDRCINSKHFEKIKCIRSKLLSENSKGEKNNFFGKRHSEETKIAIRNKRLGTDSRSTESVSKWVENVAKQPKTKEHREKIGRKNMIMLQNPDTMEIVRIDKNALSNYDGWINPRKLNPEPKYSCVHCGVTTIMANIKRWHNDNCKKKSLNDMMTKE